ncbi:uncharacterized protein LOC8027232 isoform X1 [Ixodes scapularis]|uniref:uncharacterized protein LOC8027232 isoform X1 n=1 Tax=Ixodes scapularis TaxID=6945 RepID=UPI001A9D7C33|nr:uncharacterized protein LOC8027232 isoform X1 [Ixodes scapularis]
MNDQDELRDEARFRMFVDDDNHRSLFEAFVSQANKDLGPIDKNWFYNERSSQVSACSGSDVGTALNSPSSQQSSSTCVSGATPRSSRPAELFSPCASALEWTPSPPSNRSDMFKTPAVPNPRSLLHSLGVGAAGPSPQWSPSLQTPPNGHSSEKKDMDIRKDDNLHLAPRSLFRSSTASFRSYSSEMEDVPEGKPKDIPYGDEDDEVPRQKPPSSCFGDGVTPQASRTEPKRLPVEALARCIQQGNWDEQELLESLSMAEDRSEQALPQLPSPCVTPSSSQIFVDNDNKTEDIDAHTKADMFVDQSVVDIPLIVDIDARDSSNILTVDVATSSQASGSPPARRRSATARRKLMGDPRGPVPLHSAANLGRPGKLELVAESVCAGSAGESLRDGSTSEESRMDLAFAKSQNDFLKVGYSFTQMVEVAESTMACLEAPDVGFTQSEPSEAAVSSEGILGCLLGMDSTKRAKKVAADVPPSQVALQSLTAVPVPKAIYLPSTAKAQASHSVCSDEVIEVIAEDVAPKIPTGFTTGSGKVVTVLSKSLNAAQCLLLDVGGHPIEEEKRSAVSAGGKRASVPLDSLRPGATPFKNNLVVQNDAPQDKGYVTTGFTTAGGQSVTVAASALAFGERLLHGVDSVNVSESSHLWDVPSASVPANGQFESKALFRDITNRVVKKSDPIQLPPATLSSESAERIPTGFTTGRGAAVSVLKKSLSAAKNVLSELASKDQGVELCENILVTTGFTTGNGRTVTVGQRMLHSACKFPGDQKMNGEDGALSEVSALEGLTAAERGVLANSGPEQASFVSEFQTAGDMPVCIKKTPLNHASRLFEDECPQTRCKDAERNAFTSSTTESGDTASASFDSLRKVALLFNETQKADVGNTTLTDDLKVSSSVSGFKTAGGRQVCIPEESLSRACKLFRDKRLEACCGDAARTISTSFTAGSGTAVSVSSDSLQKVASLSGEAEKTHFGNVASTKVCESRSKPAKVGVAEATNHVATGFKTCSGRVVTVARDSLTTAQGLLHDVTKEVASFDGLPNGKSDVAARSDVVTGFTTCTGKPASVHSDSLDAASRVLGASTKNASLDDLEEMPDALRQQDIRGRLSAPPLASVSCLSVAQGTPQRLANGLVANSSPGIASEAQRTPQSASAMFKSRLKGVARAPSFVTPFKAVGKPQTPTVAAKTTVAPPRSLFRKSQIQPGKLWIMRRVLKKDRISLKEAFEGNAPRFYSCEELAAFGVSGVTASVNSISAVNFEFSAPPPDALIILGDGATVQPSPGQSRLGKSELYSAFLGVPGVDSSLISREWFDNHYRWIVWKLASLEQHGPHVFAGRSLTPDNVMLQMKYRYDVEIDHSTRSALRKILERDDIASGTLILCVSGISREENALRVEVTDGWYGLRAEFDEPLSKLVFENRIFVGQKLITSGADIVGSTDACAPLEVPDELALRLNFNSTRRARWDAKLGYLRARQPFRVSLGSLHPKGGAVGRVDCIVIRAYPVMYLEMLSNKTAVMRSERAELVVAAKHDKLRSAFTEKLTAEVLSQVEKDDTEGLSLETLSGVQVSYSVKQIQGLTSGQDIWKALCCSADSVEIERILTPNQLRLLNEYQDQQLNQKQLALQQKLEQAFQQAEEEGKCPKERNVIPVFKVLVGGIHESDLRKNVCCVLSVWRPTDELRQTLVEGRAVSVYNVHVSPVRNVLPDVQNCAVELTTSKGTRYETVDCPEHIRIYYSRQVTSFPVLLSENGSPGRAVDIVGLVFLVSRQSERDIFYLADSKLNFVQLVVAKQSQAVLADDSVGPGHFVAATDVVLRPRNRELGKVAVVATTDFSEVTCSPHKSHLCSALVTIKEFIPDPSNFLTAALKRFQTPTPTPPTTPNAVLKTFYTYETTPNRLPWQQATAKTAPAPLKQPVFQQQPRTPAVANDGLDLSGRKSVEPGSAADLRSKQIRARIALLERYTALAPVPTLASPPSKETRKPYRKPVIANRDDKAASPESSPPMDLDTD